MSDTQFVLPDPDDEVAQAVRQMFENAALRPADPKYVTFFTKTEKSPEKSKAEGRPIYEAVEYVRILTPGDKDTIIERHVRPYDPYVWPEKYTAFRRGKEQDSGTPLDVIGVPEERAMELAHGPAKIKTIEQLADVSDGNIDILGIGGRKLREKARAYLEVIKGNAPLAEMRKENEELRAQNAHVMERLAALEKLAASSAPQEAPVPKAKKQQANP